MIQKVISFIVICVVAGSAIQADEHAAITLDEATRKQCLGVLRAGLHAADFWPSIHAAEGLTLGGYGQEVIEHLKPKLTTEENDQRRCGIARELVRAGDRHRTQVMLHFKQ